MQAFGLFFKTVGVLVVLVAVAVSDPAPRGWRQRSLRARVHVRARRSRSLAYFGASRSEAAARSSSALLALALPQAGLRARASSTRPRSSNQHAWVPIHLGPLDLSINKAVAYLLLGALLTIAARDRPDARQARRQGPGRRQAIGETIYEVAQVQVAEQGLPTKAIGRWFPYVATLMLFIWVVNMHRLHPAAALGREVHVFGVELPTLGIYAATSTLSVTLALALMTFVFTHVEGIRYNGAGRTSRAGSRRCRRRCSR